MFCFDPPLKPTREPVRCSNKLPSFTPYNRYIDDGDDWWKLMMEREREEVTAIVGKRKSHVVLCSSVLALHEGASMRKEKRTKGWGTGHVPCVWSLKWSSWAGARKGEGRADGPAQPEEREKEKKERKKKKLAGSCARLENGLRIVAPKPAGLMQSGRDLGFSLPPLFFLKPNLIQHHLLSTFMLLLFNFHNIYKNNKKHIKNLIN